MNINNGFYDSAGNVGTSQVSHGGTCYDAYSHGASLSDADVLVRSLYLLPYCSCERYNMPSCMNEQAFE